MKDYQHLGDLIKGLATWLRDEGHLSDNQVFVCLPLSLWDSEIDPSCSGLDLELVLHQLISNSIKYSSPGTPVMIAGHQNGQEVIFSVMDHGQGIDEADMEHLFDRFYRGRRGRREGIPGRGLGLPVCKTIIEGEMGGRIWVESQRDVGTQVHISLRTEPQSNRPNKQGLSDD